MKLSSTFCVGVSAIAILQGAGNSEVISNADLASRIVAARSQMPPFRISVLITRTAKDDQKVLQVFEEAIAWDGSSFELAHQYTWSVDGPVSSRSSSVAYHDGEAARIEGSTARVSSKVSSFGLGLAMFQHYARWYFLSNLDGEITRQDLLGVLAEADARVLPDLEEVDGHPCILVERRDETGSAFERIWIDPARSYLPRLHQVLLASTGEVLSQWHIAEFVEAAPGCFLPMRGGWEMLEAGEGPSSTPQLLMETMELMPIAHGPNPFVATDIEDVTGRLLVPEGTMVEDLDTGESWIVSQSGIRDAVRASFAAVGVDPPVKAATEVRGAVLLTSIAGLCVVGFAAGVVSRRARG